MDYQLLLGVESDPCSSLNFCVEHNLSSGLHLLPYMEMFGTSESFRRALQKSKSKVSHSFSFLYPTHRYKKKVCSLWISCYMVLRGHPSTRMFDFNPNCHGPNSQEMSLLEEQCNPQDRQPSLKATQYLRKTYRLWVSDLRFLATSVCYVSAATYSSSTLKPHTR